MARLVKFLENEDGVKIRVHWKRLAKFEDTYKPLKQVYEDAPQFLTKLSERENTPNAIAKHTPDALRLQEWQTLAPTKGN